MKIATDIQRLRAVIGWHEDMVDTVKSQMERHPEMQRDHDRHISEVIRLKAKLRDMIHDENNARAKALLVERLSVA